MRAGDVELELRPERPQAQHGLGQRVALGEPGQLTLERGDPLPGSGKLIGQAIPVSRTHLELSIGAPETVLERAFR